MPERRAIPADDLPATLSREVPLGAEELQAGWSASEEQVSLGRRLFFDPVLSRDRSLACASCHRPEFAFADDRRFSPGLGGALGQRNSPSLLNKGLSVNVMWDGRAATLEEQALLPIESPDELGLGVEEALDRLAAEPEYVRAFEASYGGPATRARLASALASFVRALVVADSPVDRFRDGQIEALTPEERAGLWLFEGRAACWRCHSGPNFSDEGFHNTGIGVVDGVPEPGRSAITGDSNDRGSFRTPGLRRLTQTAPYMHDGSLASLEDVVEFYRAGGRPNSNLAAEIRPLELSDADAANLVAFLRALSR